MSNEGLLKKRPLLAFLALALAACLWAPALLGDEMTEVYRQVYLESESLLEKHNAAQSLIALDDRSAAPILAEALEELLRTKNNFREASETAIFGRTVGLLASALGQYKLLDSAPLLWDAVQEVEDPVAQAEALIAIGRMRALDYAERIALMLRNLNLTPTTDTDAGEKLAFACIVALEKLRDARGFSPVFFATDGWYSQRVRQQAIRSLPNITADPTGPVKELIANEEPARKLKALQLELGSSAPESGKVETATLALALGHLKADANKRAEAKAFAELRKLALRALISLKARNAESVDPASDSYSKGFDDEERLLGLAALGVNATDGAASSLNSIIERLNEEVRSGITDETRTRMAEAAVAAAGATKNPIVRPALVAVANNQKWSNRLINAASTTLKALK